MGSPEAARIPNRFESVLARGDLNPTPLILPVDEDLRAFERARRTARMQGGGVLSFLLGPSGVGKTTAAHSAASHMPDRYNQVFPLPPSVELRRAAAYLNEHLPGPNGKALPVLLDGREVTDDDVGIRQFLAAANQLLRRREDLLFAWPITDDRWHAALRATAETIGGANLAPPESDLHIAGPAPADWQVVLERLLIQMDLTLSEIGIDEQVIAEYAERESTVGDFLGEVGKTLVRRVDEVQLEQALPRLVFVITSSSEVVGEANRLRRAGSLLVKAEELLSYSPRSKAAKWWRARSASPEHHLGYIISLFRARLVTMTPSSVVYACAEFGAADLQGAVKDHGFAKHRGNADRTLRSTDFYRFLAGETTSELTSTRKGKTADATLAAYGAVQGRSAKRHKAINQAIARLAGRNVEGFRDDLARFEVDLGDQDVYVDAVVPLEAEDLHLEFHHLSPPNCNAAKMSAYVMEKLQNYAVHYNLIPR